MYFSAPKDFKERELAPGVRLRLAWGERIMMSFISFQPNSVVGNHHHPHEQMGTVLKGEVEMVIGGKARVVREGEVYLVPSNVEHSARTFDRPALALDIFSPPREDYK